jgi:hypothetical protein
MPLVISNSTEKLECWFQVLVDLAYGRQVSAAVAVVGSTPDGNHIIVREVILVTLVYKLVGSCNEGQIVHVAELVRYLVTK